jgi:hypothetical protein
MQSLKTILSAMPQVSLSPEGVFKYVLITVTYKQDTVEFVRGHTDMEYHADNFNRFVKEFDQRGLELDGERLCSQTNVKISCPGGGRVNHSGNSR